MITRNLSILLTAFACSPVFSSVLPETIDVDISAVESKVIQWHRHFHQHPELSNREFKTAEKIAAHLEQLGLEVQTGVAKTGVLALQYYLLVK